LGCQLIDDGASYEDYPDFHQPALIFHAANDDVVPARYSEQVGIPFTQLTPTDCVTGFDRLTMVS
jgi:hypothetical protein